nr:hypothetical protein [bacterium]
MKKFILSIIGISIFALLTGCFTGSPIPNTITSNETATENSESSEVISSNVNQATSSVAIYSASDLFTSRDLEQEVDLEEAIYYTIEDSKDIIISKEGTYVIK